MNPSESAAERWPQRQREAAPHRPGSGSLCVEGLSGLLWGWVSVWETQQDSLLLRAGGRLQGRWCFSSVTPPCIRAWAWPPAAPMTDPVLWWSDEITPRTFTLINIMVLSSAWFQSFKGKSTNFYAIVILTIMESTSCVGKRSSVVNKKAGTVDV